MHSDLKIGKSVKTNCDWPSSNFAISCLADFIYPGCLGPGNTSLHMFMYETAWFMCRCGIFEFKFILSGELDTRLQVAWMKYLS